MKKQEKREREHERVELIGSYVEAGWGYSLFYEHFGYSKKVVNDAIARMHKSVAKRIMLLVHKNEDEYNSSAKTPKKVDRLLGLRQKEAELSPEIMALEKEFQDEKQYRAADVQKMRRLDVEIQNLLKEANQKKKEWEELVKSVNEHASNMNAAYGKLGPKRSELEKIRQEIEDLERFKIIIKVEQKEAWRDFIIEDSDGKALNDDGHKMYLAELFDMNEANSLSVETMKLAARLEAIFKNHNIERTKVELECQDDIRKNLRELAEKTAFWPNDLF